ncbi:hypothetical protein FACS1894159_08560 [Bacteroidia bacterium]|nr:hypothetical protein FACS1894159_08560 [Bacteroidia bacterium]
MFDPSAIPDPASDRPDKLYMGNWSYQLAQGWGKEGVKEFMRIYYAGVKYVDDQVGRLLDALKRNGQDKNTLVIFLSDHGDMLGNHGMVWKTTDSFYQDLVRIPMIISCPGVVRAGQYAMPVSVVDLMPTLLSAAGRKEILPAGRPGIDLIPWLDGRKNAGTFPRKYVVCERIDNNAQGRREVLPGAKAGFMISDTQWKLVQYTNGDRLLYDLKTDPDETADLASSPRAAATLDRLRHALAEWLEQTQWRGGMDFVR